MQNWKKEGLFYSFLKIQFLQFVVLEYDHYDNFPYNTTNELEILRLRGEQILILIIKTQRNVQLFLIKKSEVDIIKTKPSEVFVS